MFSDCSTSQSKCNDEYPGNVIEAVRHARSIRREIALAKSMDESELYSYAKQLQVPLDLLKKTAKMGRLPVVNFAAGGLGKQSYNNIRPVKCTQVLKTVTIF